MCCFALNPFILISNFLYIEAKMLLPNSMHIKLAVHVISFVMSSKHPQHTAIISQDEDEDDKSLYNCARKYGIILNQFHELMGIMNNPTNIPKATRRRKAGASGTSMAAGSSQPENNGALVEAVTRFLHELRVSPTDSGFSSST